MPHPVKDIQLFDDTDVKNITKTDEDESKPITDTETNNLESTIENSITSVTVSDFYGKRAFLENNLGIEADPKLVDLVSAHDSPTFNTQDNEAKPPSPIINENKTFNEDKIEENTDSKENDEVVLNQNLKQEEIVVEEQQNHQDLEQQKPSKEDNVPDDDSKSLTEVDNINEISKEKEKHLLSLGLLTHEAASAAEKEKLKLRELRNKFEKVEKRLKNIEYTGTLKTVIKLHKTNQDGQQCRMPLKMTIHKGKPKTATMDANAEQEYTIQSDHFVS